MSIKILLPATLHRSSSCFMSVMLSSNSSISVGAEKFTQSFD
ncbi:MAG: hypothetical protein Q8891_11640 [Bacteroidota bacterium]|nr:hypothetical protein [Bacteroidota bacterium]